MRLPPTESTRPDDEVLERVYQRAHVLRRRRRLRVVIPLVLASLLIIAPVALLSRGGDESSQVVTDDGSVTTGPPRTAPPPASVFYGVALTPDGPVLQQLDTTTQAVLTTYPVPQLPGENSEEGGFTMPDGLRLSPDGSILYFRRVSGSCGGPIYAVDVGDPSTMRVVVDARSDQYGPTGGIVGDYAPSADGRIVWSRCSFEDPGAIVVTDPATGDERIIQTDASLGTPALSISRDGSHLMVASYPRGIPPAEVRILDLDDPNTSLSNDTPPLEPSDGCSFDLPQLNLATDELYVIENCGPAPGQGGALIAVSLDDGSRRSVLDIDPASSVISYALDRTGGNLLYTLSTPAEPSGSTSTATFLIRDGAAPIALEGLPIPMAPAFRSGGTNLVW